MNSEFQTERQSLLKNPFLYSSIIIVLVATYTAFVLAQRYQSKRDYEKRTTAKEAQKRLADDRLAIEQLGGSELSIRALYLSPTSVHAGESAQLCYDVANAKTVTLDPPVAELWPSHSRCIGLKVKKTTTYTMTVADASGRTISQAVELIVK